MSKPRLRAAILNVCFGHNYGAVLQCVALQEQLEALGCVTTVINYTPRGLWQLYAARPNPFTSAFWMLRGCLAANEGLARSMSRTIRRAVGALSAWRNVPERRDRIERFESYRAQTLNLTRRYWSLDQLRRDPPKADIYIAGSDQIWNPLITGGVDPAFYLDFGPRAVTRAAYAVSPCRLDVEAHHSRIAALCRRLDFISLRESEMLPDLVAATSKEVSLCPDPVLLMTPGAMARFAEPVPTPRRPYVVIYGFKEPTTFGMMSRLIRRIKDSRGLDVIDISLEKTDWPFAVTRPNDLSPGTFLSYLAGSNYVVTNSFHATVFSLLYRRDFAVSIQRGTSARVVELLR
ncbi:MAG: polysaccharide pyruvyl transferase family protein, partial [Bifidobacteriaceae bacterium]|nr:polysaccharide pyruvyl transferase family protein [Bifidobacteriaceae bacterium]